MLNLIKNGLLASISLFLLFSCTSLAKRDAIDKSLVIMHSSVNGPLSWNVAGSYSIYNLDTKKIYSSSYYDSNYSIIANVPIGKYMISSYTAPIAAGVHYVMLLDTNTNVSYKYYMPYNQMGGLVGSLIVIAVSLSSRKVITNDITNVFEIKGPANYYVGSLGMNVELGNQKITHKYNTEFNDTNENAIKKILGKSDWSLNSIITQAAFTKDSFVY